MALPPKGDPRRPLHLAVRSARVLGVLFILFGLCGTVPTLMQSGRAATAPGMPLILAAMIGAAMIVYLGPGVCYLVFAAYMKDHRKWAVTATLVIASLHTLLVLLGGAGLAASIASLPEFQPQMLIQAAILVLVLLALGQMVYHLINSYAALHHPPFGREEHQGFQPVFPVQPPPGYAHPGEPPRPGEPHRDPL